MDDMMPQTTGVPNIGTENSTYVEQKLDSPTCLAVARENSLVNVISLENNVLDKYPFIFNACGFILKDKVEIISRFSKLIGNANDVYTDMLSVSLPTKELLNGNSSFPINDNDLKDSYKFFVTIDGVRMECGNDFLIGEDPRVQEIEGVRFISIVIAIKKIQFEDFEAILPNNKNLYDNCDRMFSELQSQVSINIGIGVIKDDTKEIDLSLIAGPMSEGGYIGAIKNPVPLYISNNHLYILARSVQPNRLEDTKCFTIIKKQISMKQIQNGDYTSLANSQLSVWTLDEPGTEEWNREFYLSFPIPKDSIERLGPGTQSIPIDTKEEFHIMPYHWVQMHEIPNAAFKMEMKIPVEADIYEEYQIGLLILRKDLSTNKFHIIGQNPWFAKARDFSDRLQSFTPFSDRVVLRPSFQHLQTGFKQPEAIYKEGKVICFTTGIMKYEDKIIFILGLNDAQTTLCVIKMDDLMNLLFNKVPIYDMEAKEVYLKDILK